jgi:hypothetical protein
VIFGQRRHAWRAWKKLLCAPGLTEINARHQKNRGGGLKASAYRAPALQEMLEKPAPVFTDAFA